MKFPIPIQFSCFTPYTDKGVKKIDKLMKMLKFTENIKVAR